MNDPEDASLLGGMSLSRLKPVQKKAILAAVCLVVAALIVTVAVIVSRDDGDDGGKAASPRNVILVVADGTGVMYETLARQMMPDRTLILDSLTVGTVKTYAAPGNGESGIVTDSSSSATAYSCGIKTVNAYVGVDVNGVPCTTVLESAKASGYKVGLVTTARMTHATPASFAAHTEDRDDESGIAVQYVGTAPAKVDLFMGGGRRFFIPQSEQGSSRPDDRDLTAEWQAGGRLYGETLDDFSAWVADDYPLPFLGLFALDHFPYVLDRGVSDPVPPLPTMAAAAIAALHSANAEAGGPGFFVQIEAGRPDHAGHENDAAAALKEVLEYEATVELVIEWARNDGNTLVIMVADHSTGGMTLGRDGVYEYYPQLLFDVERSLAWMSSYAIANPGLDRVAIFTNYTHLTPSAGAIAAINAAVTATDLRRAYSVATQEATLVGWTTEGHTGEDVIVHSFGDKMSPRVLAGTVDNTVLYRTMMGHFGLPLQSPGVWPQQQSGVVVNEKRGQGRISGRKNLEYGHHD